MLSLVVTSLHAFPGEELNLAALDMVRCQSLVIAKDARIHRNRARLELSRITEGRASFSTLIEQNLDVHDL
jgi:hypothetical protein